MDNPGSRWCAIMRQYETGRRPALSLSQVGSGSVWEEAAAVCERR